MTVFDFLSTLLATVFVDLNDQDHFCRPCWLQFLSTQMTKTIFVDLLVFDFCRPKCPRPFLSTFLSSVFVVLNVQDHFCRPSYLTIVSSQMSKTIFVDLNVQLSCRPKWPRQFLSTLMSNYRVDLKIFDLNISSRSNCFWNNFVLKNL